MYPHTFVVATILALALGSHAFQDLKQLHWVEQLKLLNNYTADRPLKSHHIGHFDQLIDHAHPKKGTFRQTYGYDTKYYKGPGSPIVFTTPGEAPLGDPSFFWDDNIITGRFAKAIGAAVVVIEHRYWGYSRPHKHLDTETLQGLTLENALLDFVYFARNVKFPFDKEGKSQATKAPWVFSGGSYSGAMAAWMEQLYPGTFWAYHASSAVVEAIGDFWQYFDVIQTKSLPTDCRKNIEMGVNHVDTVLANGTGKERVALKTLFNLQKLDYDDDFADAISYVLYFWQYGPDHFFCDRLAEGIKKATSHGNTKLNGIMRGWSSYVKDNACTSSACWDTHNDHPANTITGDYLWSWMLCNEPFDWFRPHEPTGQQGIIPKALTFTHDNRQCSQIHPPKNGYVVGSNRGRNVKTTNLYTKGWNRRPSTRLMWSNSARDPWSPATVSSPYRPGGPQVSTEQEPVFFTPYGYHVADFTLCRDKDKSLVCRNVEKEVQLMKKWVSEWA